MSHRTSFLALASNSSLFLIQLVHVSVYNYEATSILTASTEWNNSAELNKLNKKVMDVLSLFF